MKTHEGSVGPDDSPAESNENRFTPVLHAAFDPFLTLARTSSSEVEDITAQTIYRTNILLAARATISPFEFASATHLAPLSTALSTLRTNLLDVQHQFLLETSGLQGLLDALEPFSKSGKESEPDTESNESSEKPESQKPHLTDLTSISAFQPSSLVTSSQQLDDFLPSALMDATDNLKRVQSASLVHSVTEDAVEAFCRDFEFVEGMIIAADEARGMTQATLGTGGSVISGRSGRSGRKPGTDGDTDGDADGDGKGQWSLRSLFPRTTGEIRVLLS